MGTGSDDHDTLRRISEGLTATGAGMHLSRWLVRNHDAFAALLDEQGHPGWDRIAVALAEAGLRDARGEPPSAAAARKAWQRARAVVGARGPRTVRREAPRDVFLTDEAPVRPAPLPAAPAPGGDGLSEIRRKLAARSGVIPGND